MKKRNYLDYIQDIIASIKYIEEFVEGIDYNNFVNDRKTIFAVVKGIENIGEASKNIPTSLKNRYIEIPWKDMAGMRDKLSHAYFEIDMDVLWKTIQRDIPQLKILISKIVEDDARNRNGI